MYSNKYLIIILAISSNALAGDLFPPNVTTKESICNGRTANYSPKALVRVRYPDTKGLPIDQAAQLKADRMETVRVLLKRGYFSHYFFDATREQEADYWNSVGERPMDVTLASLRDNYTFRFPIDTLKNVFKKQTELDWQHMGYEYETVTWKASRAIDGADTMWQNYLYRMTTVSETAKETGEVVFELKLDMNLFCQTAIADASLISK